MIRLCVTLALVLGCFAPASGQEWARKMFTASDHDFGTVARGAKAVFNFEIQNIYEEDVHIASVRSSCGCTTPRITKDTIKTWEKGAIEATFNTNSFTGQRSATITVTIDRPFRAEVLLTVHGFIRTDVVVNPGGIQFGSVNMGDTKEQSVSVTYAGREDWKITDVRSANEHLEVELNRVGAGVGQVVYSMKVRLKDTAPPGYINDQLTLITDDSHLKQVTVPVEGQVLSPLTLSPSPLFLGVLGPGQAVSKKLVVRGTKEFCITGVDCPDSLKVEYNPDEVKNFHFVTVTFTAGQNPQKVAEKIKITTDLGDGISAECLATGTVQTTAADTAAN